MRVIPILLIALTGCEMLEPSPSSADAASRAPITSRERALIYAADGAAAQGNYPAAERDYMAAMSEGSGHTEAHLGLAQLYLKKGQNDKALPVFEKALEVDPNHAFTNYLVGKLYLDANRYTDATGAFDRGLKQQPNNLDLATGKGVTEDMQGNHIAAQMQYLRAMKTNPTANLSNVRTNLAMSYMLSGEPKKAADLLKNEGNKAGASSVTRHNLALAYGLLGQHAQAKKLINGEMDEATRQLTMARMREYAEQRGGMKTLPLKPRMSADVTTQAPVAKPAPKKVVKPVVSTKPTPAATVQTPAVEPLVDAAKKGSARE